MTAIVDGRDRLAAVVAMLSLTAATPDWYVGKSLVRQDGRQTNLADEAVRFWQPCARGLSCIYQDG